MIKTYNFDLFADYFQIYLQDEKAEVDLSKIWTEEAIDRKLALAPGIICVGTARNMTVPLTIEVHDDAPEETQGDWNQINECNIEVPSGKLVVLGCTDYFPDAARIDLMPGNYFARIYYGGLESISWNGLDGEDHYVVRLWRSAIENAPA